MYILNVIMKINDILINIYVSDLLFAPNTVGLSHRLRSITRQQCMSQTSFLALTRFKFRAP